jgi:hypothetical protein
MKADLLLYTRDYLERHALGHRWFQPSEDEYEVDITLPATTRAKLDNFIASKRLQGLTRLAEGGSRLCKFVNKVKGGGASREQINQFHPLIRFISEEIGEETSILSVICVKMPFTSITSETAPPGLGYHLKTGHTLSVQNRPTGLAEDVIVLPCRSVDLQGVA